MLMTCLFFQSLLWSRSHWFFLTFFDIDVFIMHVVMTRTDAIRIMNEYECSCLFITLKSVYWLVTSGNYFEPYLQWNFVFISHCNSLSSLYMHVIIFVTIFQPFRLLTQKICLNLFFDRVEHDLINPWCFPFVNYPILNDPKMKSAFLISFKTSKKYFSFC